MALPLRGGPSLGDPPLRGGLPRGGPRFGAGFPRGGPLVSEPGHRGASGAPHRPAGQAAVHSPRPRGRTTRDAHERVRAPWSTRPHTARDRHGHVRATVDIAHQPRTSPLASLRPRAQTARPGSAARSSPAVRSPLAGPAVRSPLAGPAVRFPLAALAGPVAVSRPLAAGRPLAGPITGRPQSKAVRWSGRCWRPVGAGRSLVAGVRSWSGRRLRFGRRLGLGRVGLLRRARPGVAGRSLGRLAVRSRSALWLLAGRRPRPRCGLGVRLLPPRPHSRVATARLSCGFPLRK